MWILWSHNYVDTWAHACVTSFDVITAPNLNSTPYRDFLDNCVLPAEHCGDSEQMNRCPHMPIMLNLSCEKTVFFLNPFTLLIYTYAVFQLAYFHFCMIWFPVLFQYKDKKTQVLLVGQNLEDQKWCLWEWVNSSNWCL